MALIGPLIGLLFFGSTACAQVNPFSVLGKVVTTSMDVRTKAEVTADTCLLYTSPSPRD